MSDKPLAGAVRVAKGLHLHWEHEPQAVKDSLAYSVQRDSGLLELVEAAASWMSIYRASMESRLKAIELHQLGVVPEAAARLETAIDNVRKP